MAATSLRQAAARLASGLASSRPARAVGKTLAAGATTYSAAEWAMSETLPYGADGRDGGGRRRGPVLWAAMLGGWPDPLDHATSSELSAIGHTEVLSQLGPDGLRPVPAGEVRVHWLKPEERVSEPLDTFYPEPYRRAIEASMEAVAAALRQEAEEQGFGKHVLKHGFHLIVTPNDSKPAFSLPTDTVVLPLSHINACLRFGCTPNGKPDEAAAMAAIQFTLAHELAHLYLRHVDERLLQDAMLLGAFKAGVGLRMAASALRLGAAADATKPDDTEARLSAYQAFASLHKELYWQQEFEADEVACALLARLRLSPEHLAAGVRNLANMTALEARDFLQLLLKAQRQYSPEQKRREAADLGFPAADFDAGVDLVKAAVATGDPDAFARLCSSFEAIRAERRLLEEAQDGGSGTVCVGKTALLPAVVEGPLACPERGVSAMLADLASTHPYAAARLARVRQLSAQLPMLLRATAPPVAVGGRYSHGSVAEQVAQQLREGLAAQEAAAKEAAAKAAAANRKLAALLVAGMAAAGAVAAATFKRSA